MLNKLASQLVTCPTQTLIGTFLHTVHELFGSSACLKVGTLHMFVVRNYPAWSLYPDYLMLIINCPHSVSVKGAEIQCLGGFGLGLTLVSSEGQVRVKLRSGLPEHAVTLCCIYILSPDSYLSVSIRLSC